MDLSDAIANLQSCIEFEGIDATKGVGENLFLFLSTLVPMVNVDILVTGHDNQILLEWRDDKHCGKGWHIPGGCIRFHQSIEECLHDTATRELGTDIVSYNFIGVYQGIRDSKSVMNPKERSHFISLLYKCDIDTKELINLDDKEVPGHLKWFDKVPVNLIDTQDYYKEPLAKVLLKSEKDNCQK